jgi:hypothetical protein
MFRLGAIATGSKMNLSRSLSFTKINLVGCMSESLTQMDGIALA